MGFATRNSLVNNTTIMHRHVDVNGNKINKENGLGNYIEIEYKIENDIFKSVYGHLYPNSTKLKEGQIVKMGEKIAEIGTTGYSTGNHLDWQLYQNNKVIDGMDLIDFNL